MEQNEKLEYLRGELRRREVVFCYRTVGGRVRPAVGTLEADKLPPTKGTGGAGREAVMTYFDVEEGAWRSFRKENLMYVDLLVN